ncbi:MAG TPA: hypothetical protein VFS75_00845 [Candidatus Paceibacterota bacterium]|nr:hypothetical protein [Candidatus Paceibacterota bacterium]
MKRRVHNGNRYGGMAQTARQGRKASPPKTVVVVREDALDRFNTRYVKRPQKVTPPLESVSFILWERVSKSVRIRLEKIYEAFDAIRTRYSSFHVRLCENFLDALKRFASGAEELIAVVIAEGAYPGAGKFVQLRVANQTFAVPDSLVSGLRKNKKP